MDSPVDIPQKLQTRVEAALAWLNASQGAQFELSGVVDYEQALDAAPDEPIELGLVLCDGELCAREEVRIVPQGDRLSFSLVAAAAREIPELLDPPEGVRAQWLDGVLAKHEFVLLLFYRGLW